MKNTYRFIDCFFADKDSSSACLITSRSNRYYLTGVSSSDGLVFVTREKVYLIVDFRYFEIADQNAFSGVEVIHASGRFSGVVKEIVAKHCIKCVYIEDTQMCVSDFERYKSIFSDLRFDFLGTLLEEVRCLKTAEEIEFIRSAQKITDKAFEHILNYINAYRTESQVALELERYMRLNGADGIAFDTICVSGTKSSLPHGVPSDINLSENSFITMDYGAKYRGYCADMTRTVVLGRADDEMIKVYNTVFEAQAMALEKIKSGVSGDIVDAAARDHIYSNGYKGCFGHSTGHGLGIDVHETPSFSPNYKKAIPSGAVLSVEPGIYIEGRFGVRIEDIVVVRDDGYENLTKSKKNLIEL